MSPLTLHTEMTFTDGYGAQVAFSPNGATWVSATPTHVYVREAERILYTITRSERAVGRVAFATHERYLFIGTQVLDLAARRLLDFSPLAATLGAVELQDAAWSPDGGDLVVLGGGRLLLLEGHRRGLVAGLWEENPPTPGAVAVSETLIALVSDRLRVWERATQRLIAARPLFAGLHDIHFSAGGGFLVGSGADGWVTIWETREWEPVQVWQAHEGMTRAVLHPTLPLAATGGDDGAIKLWELSGDPAMVVALATGGAIEDLAFHPRGEWLMVAEQRLISYCRLVSHV